MLDKIVLTVALLLGLSSTTKASAVSWKSLAESERHELFQYWLDRSLAAVHIFISNSISDQDMSPTLAAIQRQMLVSNFWIGRVAMPGEGADLELILKVQEHVADGRTRILCSSVGTFTKGQEAEVIFASQGTIPLRGETPSPVLPSYTFNKKNLGELASLLIIPIPASDGLQGEFEYMDPTTERWRLIPGFYWEPISESAYNSKLKAMQELAL